MDSLYVHTPLHKPTEKIRLLRWHPPDQSISNDQTPRYTLSSCDCTERWPGRDSIPTFPVSINENIIQVRMHCWHALWQLRYHQIRHNIWIDSICINQMNNAEKGAQVAMMANIFENASSVAACVGTGTILNCLRTSLASHDGELAHDVFSELGHRPYFDRLWVKQELILARQVTLFYGRDEVSWEDFETLRDDLLLEANDGSVNVAMARKSTRRKTLEYHKALSLMLDRESRVQNRPRGHACHELIKPRHTYGHAKCMDPRDKIYALLSLRPEDCSGRDITPDYDLSIFRMRSCRMKIYYLFATNEIYILFRTRVYRYFLPP